MSVRSCRTISLMATLVILVVGGCSGPGQTPGELTGATTQSVAAEHVSAVLLAKSWLAILYPPPGGGGSCEPVQNYEFLPDGSMRITGTNSDCTQFDYLQKPDMSGEGTITTPGGKTSTTEWTAPTYTAGGMSHHIRKVMADGPVLDLDYSMDWSRAGTPQTRKGTATLTDGRTMQFTHVRAQDVEDKLAVTLPDGSQLELTIPLTSATGAIYWPVFSQGAPGVFTAPSGRQFDFTIAGADDMWKTWTFASSDGREGTFSLGEGLIGSGRLREHGDIIGALSWVSQGVGTLDLVDAGSAQVIPSAAARDFQLDRWISSIAALGPAPMY